MAPLPKVGFPKVPLAGAQTGVRVGLGVKVNIGVLVGVKVGARMVEAKLLLETVLGRLAVVN